MKEDVATQPETKRRGKLFEIWRRFRKNKAAVLGLVILVLLIFTALFVGLFVDYGAATKNDVMNKLQPPSVEHVLGTDSFGRDILARILFGTRYSLAIGLITTMCSVLIGLVLASLAAYYGGWVDNLIMRAIDVITSIPSLLLSLSIVAALGASVINLFIAMTISGIPTFVRVIRSALLNIVNQEYVEAARACGTHTGRILTKHVISNAASSIIVAATMNVATMILAAATLSFLGLGFQPPTPEWGAMLSEARDYIRTNGFMMIPPGCMIILSSLSINLVGDGLRDALDPKLRN